MLNTNSFDIMDTFKPKQDLARLERVRKQTTACFTIIAAAAVVVIIIFIIIYLFITTILSFCWHFLSLACVSTTGRRFYLSTGISGHQSSAG